jgi:ketosteroid isomerase-like protein
MPAKENIAPTGKRFAVRGVSTARLEGDTIVRIDLYWDRLAMVEQLGASLNAN